ncbi:MAG: hypothetical protein HZC36_15805 [Armatimonadetes bacterium]|nr:hypothetical protein [Armatimonadota bacterium]
MHYIVYVRLLHFYASSLAESRPDLQGRPFIVHKDKAVLEASSEALSLGIAPGMRLQEAKILLKSNSGVCIAWEEDLFRAHQEAWLDACCRFTDVVEPDRQHGAYLDISAHPDPFDIAEQLALSLKDNGYMGSRVGLSRCKWVALLATERLSLDVGSPEWRVTACEAIERPSEFLAAFPTDCLLPVLPEHRQRIGFLGYRTIGEVQRIPMRVLKEQFAEHAPLIHAASRGGISEPVAAVYPKARVLAAVAFEGGTDSPETLDRGLRDLGQRVAGMLMRRDAVSYHLQLEIEYEDGKLEPRQRVFAKPISNLASAIMAIRLLTGERFQQPIVRISVRIDKLEPAQKEQYELGGRTASTVQALHLGNAFRSIRTSFGDRAIQSGASLPLTRRERVLKAWKEATGWV